MGDGVRRGHRLAGVGLIVIGVLAGCATVPTSGRVGYGRAIGSGAGGLDDSDVRLLPPAPRPGETPAEIVLGFLAASANFDAGHAIARRFLTPEAAERWDPDRGITVYDPAGRSLSSAGPAAAGPAQTVTVTAPRVATIATDGGYTLSPGRIVTPLRLVREGSDWRLADVPPGLLLTTTDVQRNLRSVYSYFLDPTQTVVVADHVFVRAPARGRPTALVRALLDGPSRWLAPAVTTAFPPGTELIGNAPLEGSVVAVNLSGEAARAGPAARAAMSAQLVWTLRQLPDVSGVRITIEGSPLEAPGARTVQSTSDWPTFDPDGPGVGAGFYFVRDGRLLSLERGPVPGPLGRGGFTLEHPAVGGLGSDVVAGLRTVGAESVLYVGPVTGVPVPRLRAPRGQLTVPSVDRSGAVWTVRGGAGAAVVRLPPSGPATEVPAAELLRLGPTGELRISSDGTRVAALVGAAGHRHLVVGRVVVKSAGRPALEGFRAVDAALSAPSSLAWADGHRVALLAGTGTSSNRAPWLVEADGSLATTVATTGLPPGGPTALSAGPADVVLVAAGGSIWRSSGGPWVRIALGSDPTRSR